MLERIWQQYQHVFRAVASSLLADKSLVDDALQDAFTKLLRAGRTFETDRQAFCFIRQTVRNASVDQFRRARRHTRRFPSYDDPCVGEGWRPVDFDNPLSRLEEEERVREYHHLLREVRSGLRRLSPPQRQAIRVLVGRNNRSVRRTCVRLGVPYSTLRSRMLSGLDVLRKHLRARGVLEENRRGGGS